MTAHWLPLDHPASTRADDVGHKCANLAQARNKGFAIPPAVVIPVQAHRYYHHEKKWPDGLKASIIQAAQHLGLDAGVAVRSSGTREDLGEHSFAGQYATLLDVRDPQALLGAVEACWSSQESDQVRAYEDQHEGSGQAGWVAVLIQKMVPARHAGVAFSRNPLFPARAETIVEAVDGLGEGLVNGQRSPVRATLRGKEPVRVEEAPSNTPSVALADETWRRIGAMAMTLEQHFGHPQDIEWAEDHEGTLWLLQSRPISTIRPEDMRIPAGLWTRKIANDLWSDRLTPFLAREMERNASRFDLSRAAGWLGIPVARPSVRVINGFLYVNAERITAILQGIPQNFRLSNLSSLVPPSRRVDPGPTKWSRVVSSSLRALLFFAGNPWANPLSSGLVNRIHRHLMGGKLRRQGRRSVQTPGQSLAAIDTDLALLARNQQRNQWPYAYATGLTWTLQWVLEEKLGLNQEVFLTLLNKRGDNVTLRIERTLRTLAGRIARNPALRHRFQTEPIERLRFNLPQWLQIELANFMNRYGCRSPHRTLTVPRWEEDPGQVLAFLRSLSAEPRSGTNAPRASIDTWCQIPLFWRPFVWILLRATRSFLDLREELRFVLDKNLCLLRRHLLRLGKQTGLGEHIVFLTREELQTLVHSPEERDRLIGLAEERIQRHRQSEYAPVYYSDGRAEEEFMIQEGSLQGIGTSAGQTSGTAQIVQDPSEVRLRGEVIVVAAHTDPGWTPLLSLVKGVIVEEGGLLSHCAIVARELGIPAVVGVPRATTRIPDGAQVSLNGATGHIAIATDPA